MSILPGVRKLKIKSGLRPSSFYQHEKDINGDIDEETIRATKLEAISILAGGIAHDFNNLLTVILGNLSIAKTYVGNSPEVSRKLAEIEQATLQTKELTKQLLMLAKGNTLVKNVSSVEDFLTEMVNFALHGSNIRAVFEFPDDLPHVQIDHARFSQVIHNIVINAVQAMQPAGGVLHIRAISYNRSENDRLLAEGQYVKISFKDQGSGIAPTVMKRIFEPFFTTKEYGNGLGLATSYHIVKQHEGHLTVESEYGHGSTFHIFLPVTADTQHAVNAQSGIFRGQGRVLLMDDEYSVRKTAGEMLRILGYEVDFAVSGEEVLMRYLREKKRGAGYDAVILDMTVRGGMGGQRTMEKLLQADSDVKAIISSGYTNAPLLAEYQNYGFRGFVFKPYRLEEFSTVLHNVISQKKSGETG